MDQQKRLLIAIGLSLGLTMVFTKLVWEPQAEQERVKQATADAGALATLDAGAMSPQLAVAPPTLAAAVDAGDADAGALAVQQPVQEAPLRELKVDRPSTNLVFTSEGAGLTDAVLRGRREHIEQSLSIPDGYKKLFGASFPPPPQVDLAEPVPGGAPQVGLSITGASPVSARARYAVVEEAPGRLAFSTTQGAWEVTRTFTFDPAAAPPQDAAKEPLEKDASPYTMVLEVKVKNVSAAPQAGELVMHAVRAIDPSQEQAPSMFGGIGNQSTVVCRVGDDIKRKSPDNDKPLEEEKGAIGFVALDQQYFLSAIWPMDAAAEGRCAMNATTTTRSADLAVPLALGPGEATTRRFGVFLGPKDLDLLMAIAKLKPKEAPAATFDPGLDKTVDFGWWAFICKALLVFLRLFHGFAGNWGVAIILLTVMVKVVLLPLTHRAMVSAEQMKKLQPRMEEIRKKFPDDKEKQNVEMMRLYQEAKVNPLGGCLPLLLQMPIWIALFTTLRTSYELYGEPFFGVWSDLTSKDPTYLLPLALGVTMIITQRLQPQMMDKSQAVLMTWVMPVFFTALMMNYPAGLALYIFTNNLLSIAQQFALRKWLERTGQAAPKGVKAGAR